MTEYNENIAVLIARLFLGVLFFIQGYDKVFNLKLKEVICGFREELGEKNFSDPVLKVSAYYSSYAELVGGILLIAGFLKFYALCALGIDLLLVAVAMGVIKPLWSMDYVFPRLVLLLILLFLPPHLDIFSLDFLLQH